ncbi:hypothetical protein BaRGS_00037452 [Batillaria attramentaria]|uniref:Peroxidase n=1 Tax=Batillaria attramentaria TaxID=370345 RepID=A0ABD0J8R8_9CAEN
MTQRSVPTDHVILPSDLDAQCLVSTVTCYYRSQGAGNSVSRPQSSERDPQAVVQPNCFELPEMAAGEMTGLLDDTQSELRQCPHENPEPECRDPMKLKYRTIDGSCNNVANPRWGKSFEPQQRLLAPHYINGTLPRMFSKIPGEKLPLPRRISKIVSPQQNSVAHGVSNMVMAWGQFIDHDFTGTPVTKNGSRTIKCCGDIADELKMENGEQINTLTSFLDGSAVYGNTQEAFDELKGKDGKMLVTEDNMLPESKSSTCKKEKVGDYCLAAGDHRVNVFVGLGGLHTLFVREHNRLATKLKTINPGWDADKIFEETRRIVSAEFQHITYADWLPLVLDTDTLTKYRLGQNDYNYDPDINPTITNVFSTASFRFGHSQVKQSVQIGKRKLQLQDTLLRPTFTLNHLTDALEGLVSAPTDEVDPFFANGLTDHMFETNSTAHDGLDLVSSNIQRGRDHGLPPYNDWREFCGLPRITDFDTTEFISKSLASVYRHVDDIDLFVGAICEKHLPGALVGPTFACLLGKQFHDIKFGDRFFYETRSRPERFTFQQLKQIQQISLSKIICDNTDMVDIQRDAFRTEDSVSNPRVNCKSLPGINLDLWRAISTTSINRFAPSRNG